MGDFVIKTFFLSTLIGVEICKANTVGHQWSIENVVRACVETGQGPEISLPDILNQVTENYPLKIDFRSAFSFVLAAYILTNFSQEAIAAELPLVEDLQPVPYESLQILGEIPLNVALADIDYISQIVEKEYPDLDINSWTHSVKMTKEKIRKIGDINDLSYSDLAVQLLQTLGDSHVQARSAAAETMTMGNKVWYTTGIVTKKIFDTDGSFRVVVSQVHDPKIDLSSKESLIGAEIVAVDGKDISLFLQELSAYHNTGREDRNHNYLANYITMRPADQFPLLPKNPIELSLRRKGKQTKISLDWTIKKIQPELTIEERLPLETNLPINSAHPWQNEFGSYQVVNISNDPILGPIFILQELPSGEKAAVLSYLDFERMLSPRTGEFITSAEFADAFENLNHEFNPDVFYLDLRDNHGGVIEIGLQIYSAISSSHDSHLTFLRPPNLLTLRELNRLSRRIPSSKRGLIKKEISDAIENLKEQRLSHKPKPMTFHLFNPWIDGLNVLAGKKIRTLIGSDTASTAEILAALARVDHHLIIGTGNSGGAWGSVSTYHTSPLGINFQVPTQRFLVDNSSYETIGIKPDIIINASGVTFFEKLFASIPEIQKLEETSSSNEPASKI